MTNPTAQWLDDPGAAEPPWDEPYADVGAIESATPALPAPTFRDLLLSVSDLGRLPAVEPLVDELLFRNTLAQLAGPPGSYKSFIAVGIACALSSGQKNWAGHRIRKREKVVYVAAEGASGLRARILAWCEREKVDPGELEGWLFILPLPLQLGSVIHVDQAVEMVKDVGAGLLILDTRARCTLGLEENSATEQGRAVESAERIRAAADCTVWGIHHSGRNGSAPRGSTAWDGAVWSDLRLTSEDGTAAITVEKHKDAPSNRTFDYRLVPHTVSETAMPDVPESARKSLVVFSNDSENSGGFLTGILTRGCDTVRNIAENSCGLEGLSRTALVDMAGTAGIPKASAYRAVNTLIKAGTLHNVGTDKQRRYIYMGQQLGAGDDA